MSEALAYLDTLLRARVVLTEARHGRVSSTSPIRSGIVPTARLILFTSGRATYVLEDRPLPIAPGTMLLVPALAKRAWRPIKSVGISFFSLNDGLGSLTATIRPSRTVASSQLLQTPET